MVYLNEVEEMIDCVEVWIFRQSLLLKLFISKGMFAGLLS
jgi:hypothetical protein